MGGGCKKFYRRRRKRIVFANGEKSSKVEFSLYTNEVVIVVGHELESCDLFVTGMTNIMCTEVSDR